MVDRWFVRAWFVRWRGAVMVVAGLGYLCLYLFTDAMQTPTWVIFGLIFVIAGAGSWVSRVRAERRE